MSVVGKQRVRRSKGYLACWRWIEEVTSGHRLEGGEGFRPVAIWVAVYQELGIASAKALGCNCA